jgi:hypothetical protein
MLDKRSCSAFAVASEDDAKLRLAATVAGPIRPVPFLASGNGVLTHALTLRTALAFALS